MKQQCNLLLYEARKTTGQIRLESTGNTGNEEGDNYEATDSEAIIEPLNLEEAKELQDFDPKLKKSGNMAAIKLYLEKYMRIFQSQ